MSTPTEPPFLVLRRQAPDAGLVDDEIRRRRRRGEWSDLQRGAYLVGPGRPGPRQRHLLMVRATLAGLRVPAVVSHSSAAALHGLPLWGLPLRQVHVTREPPARSADERRLRSHVARLAPQDIAFVDGTAVTSVARTVLDVARAAPFQAALAVADAALASGLTTSEELLTALHAGAGTRGSRSARRVVAAADRRSESVGESRSRALMLDAGVPLPELQVEVRRPDGALVGGATSAGRSTVCSASSTGASRTDGCSAPASIPGTRCSRRSDARTLSGTRGTAWSAGSGTSSTPLAPWSRGGPGRSSARADLATGPGVR